MAVDKKIIKLLRNLGLTSYEASAYSILALAGSLPAVDIADLTKIPRPRVYDVLKKLDQRGFILVQPGKPTKYKAISPSELIKLLEERGKERLESIKTAGKDFVQKLEPIHKRMVLPEELAWVIKGNDNLKKRTEAILESAKRVSVIASYKKSVFLKDKILKGRLKKLKARCLIDERMPELKANLFPVGNFGMIIADGRECLILSQEGVEPEYNVGMLIRNPDIASGFEQIFNSIWKKL